MAAQPSSFQFPPLDLDLYADLQRCHNQTAKETGVLIRRTRPRMTNGVQSSSSKRATIILSWTRKELIRAQESLEPETDVSEEVEELRKAERSRYKDRSKTYDPGLRNLQLQRASLLLDLSESIFAQQRAAKLAIEAAQLARRMQV